MTITVEKAQLNNQSTLENFGLVEELDAQSAEIISGGWCGGYHPPIWCGGYLISCTFTYRHRESQNMGDKDT